MTHASWSHGPRAVLAVLLPAVALVVAGALSAAGGGAVRPAVSSGGGTAIVASPDPELSDLAAPTPPPMPATLPAAGLVVPILVYHFIRVNPVPTDLVGFNLSVTPTAFDAQLARLQSVGAHTITPAQLRAALSGGQPLPPRPVMLTFDDGFADFATAAAPTLAAHHFVGVAFVVSGFIGHPNYMTADQVEQVSAMGMVIGAHTVSHIALAQQPATVVAEQVTASKSALEHLTGHPVVDFAYPYGSYSAATIPLVEAAGFADAMTMDAGSSQRSGQLFRLQRVRVGGTDTPGSVAAKALLVGSVRGGTPLPALPAAASQLTAVRAGVTPRPCRHGVL